MTTATDPTLTLHQLFSPAFPVGAFAYSHGAEAAVQAGLLTTAQAVQDWLADILEHGGGWSDAVLMAHAARGGDVAELDALARALSPAAERRLETEAQGAAFAATVRSVWDVPVIDAAYPVAVGQTVRALELPLTEALRLYLQAFAANIAGACTRLIPLGQTEGQRITAALSPLCAELARHAAEAELDDIGGFVPRVDIMGQRHAALYSRIFRS